MCLCDLCQGGCMCDGCENLGHCPDKFHCDEDEEEEPE